MGGVNLYVRGSMLPFPFFFSHEPESSDIDILLYKGKEGTSLLHISLSNT